MRLEGLTERARKTMFANRLDDVADALNRTVHSVAESHAVGRLVATEHQYKEIRQIVDDLRKIAKDVHDGGLVSD
jgi:hypothetical protein